MTASSIAPLFSTPRYATEASGYPARRRIVVAQQADAGAALLDHPAPTLLLCLGETLTTSVDQEGLPSVEALYLRLQMLLEQAEAGTRLYVTGDESFIWHVYRLARDAGLQGDEIELFRLGTRRRLYCVHCANFQDIGREAACTCTHCGVKLLVREHFSQRLGAYMGVCLDPDSPYAQEASA